MRCPLPSDWVNKLGSMAIATGLVYVSCRLDNLESLLSPYQAIAHQQSTASYQAWLNHSMKPPARELQVNTEILKPIPTHPILKALYGLTLECDFVQELRSPSFIRTLIKPTNCKVSQVLATWDCYRIRPKTCKIALKGSFFRQLLARK